MTRYWPFHFWAFVVVSLVLFVVSGFEWIALAYGPLYYIAGYAVLVLTGRLLGLLDRLGTPSAKQPEVKR